MRHIVINKAKVAIVTLSLLALTMGFTGCGGGEPAAADETKTTSTPTGTATTSTSPKASKSTTTKSAAQTVSKTGAATKTVVPKLTDVSFTLSLETGQEYAEVTTPIYLQASQVLHLSWLVVKGGNYFYMTFSMPSGKVIAIRSNGSLAAYTPAVLADEKLTKSGDVVFRPSDNDWGDGYYIFHSQINKGDTPVTVKLLYWIEG